MNYGMKPVRRGLLDDPMGGGSYGMPIMPAAGPGQSRMGAPMQGGAGGMPSFGGGGMGRGITIPPARGTELEEMARGMGVDPSLPMDQVMREMWNRSPTDSVGEFIDNASRKYGVPPPWSGQ
jgi:hypothetical protein